MIKNYFGIGHEYGAKLICDICGHEEKFEGACEEESDDAFYAAVNFKKDKNNGWKCQRKEGKWLDICPNCIAAKEARNREKRL